MSWSCSGKLSMSRSVFSCDPLCLSADRPGSMCLFLLYSVLPVGQEPYPAQKMLMMEMTITNSETQKMFTEQNDIKLCNTFCTLFKLYTKSKWSVLLMSVYFQRAFHYNRTLINLLNSLIKTPMSNCQDLMRYECLASWTHEN